MADQQGTGLLNQMVRQQARFMAYMDIYFIFAAMAILAFPFVFLMKKSAGKSSVSAH
jgi:hypothetical protein